MEYHFTSLAHAEKLKAEHIILLEQLKDAEAHQHQAEGILSCVLMDDTSTPAQIAEARKALPDAVQRADGLRHECISYVTAIDSYLQQNREAAVQEWQQYLADIESRFNAAAMPLTDTTTVVQIMQQADAIDEAHRDLNRLQRAFTAWYRQFAGTIAHLRPAMDAGASITAIAQAIRNHQIFTVKQSQPTVEKIAAPPPPQAHIPEPTPKARRLRQSGVLTIGRDV